MPDSLTTAMVKDRIGSSKRFDGPGSDPPHGADVRPNGTTRYLAMGQEGGRLTTMADVARHAGVSLSTVSYVLSGKRTISPATRDRVRTAITETGFAINARGRALASRQTRTVILLFPSLASDLGAANMEFVQGCLVAARADGYSVMVSLSDDPYEETRRATRGGVADGVILMEIETDDPRVRLLRDQLTPFTLIGHQDDNTGIDFVDLDFADAMRVSLDHLHDLGHRDVVLLLPRRSHQGPAYGPHVRSRDAFLIHLAERGMTGELRECPASARGGQDGLGTLLSTRPYLTGAITTSAELVPGMIRAASEVGRSVPSDVSIVTLASPSVAEHAAPPLTSVDFPTGEMGQIATSMLIDRLEGRAQHVPHQVMLRGTLTVRGTSAPPPDPAPSRPP